MPKRTARANAAKSEIRAASSTCGILQSDAYAGFGEFYAAGRWPGSATQALCWAHARRKFFELADIAANTRNRSAGVISPIALEAVTRIDATFDAERTTTGTATDARLAARQAAVAPLVGNLEAWMREERASPVLCSGPPAANAPVVSMRRGAAGLDARRCALIRRPGRTDCRHDRILVEEKDGSARTVSSTL